MSVLRKRLAHGGVAVALCMGAMAVASPAFAGPWPLEKGKGQAIATFYYSDSPKGFDGNGDVIDMRDYTKTELYLLMEYGVTDDLTVIVTPSLRDVTVENGQDSKGLGYTDVGARYRVFHKDGMVVSLQGLARIPGDSRRDVLAQVGNTDAEYDLRMLVGDTFKVGKGYAFLDVQGAYRFRTGNPPDEYHADVTLGYRPVPQLMFLAQSFNTISNGSGEGVFRSYNYSNAQLSAVYDISPKVSVQLGALGTIAGKNALRERGLFTGLWFHF